MKKVRDVLYLAFSIVLGVVLLLALPFYLFDAGILPTGMGRDWVVNRYMVLSTAFMLISIISAFMWYFLTQKEAKRSVRNLGQQRLWYALLCILIALSVCLVLFAFRQTSARAYILLFYLTSIFFFYWIPTAIGFSKGNRFIPPLSMLFRFLVGDRKS